MYEEYMKSAFYLLPTKTRALKKKKKKRLETPETKTQGR